MKRKNNVCWLSSNAAHKQEANRSQATKHYIQSVCVSVPSLKEESITGQCGFKRQTNTEHERDKAEETLKK
jgi:hypothetical protein